MAGTETQKSTKKLEGVGRVTIFRTRHLWSPPSYCVLAFTTIPDEYQTSILGVIPVEGNVHEPGDLFAMAGRHDPSRLYGGTTPEQARAAWLACTGSSARLVKAPDTLDVEEASWALDMSQSALLKDPMYGTSRVAAGRMTLTDPALLERAYGLLRGR